MAMAPLGMDPGKRNALVGGRLAPHGRTGGNAQGALNALFTPARLQARRKQLEALVKRNLRTDALTPICPMGRLQTVNGIVPVGLRDFNDQYATLHHLESGAFLGVVSRTGTLQLVADPRDWDLYNNPLLDVDYLPLYAACKMGPDFRARLQARAEVSSAAPWIRKAIHQEMGLTGRGVRVEILDLETPHATMVRHVMTGARYGISPGAQAGITFLSPQEAILPENPTLAQLDRYLTRIFTVCIDDCSRRFEQMLLAARQGSPLPHLINLSITNSPAIFYKKLNEVELPAVSQSLAQARQKGLPIDSRVTALLQRTQSDNPNMAVRTVIQYADTLLTRPEVSATMRRYQALTHALAQRGVSIVVANGNEQHVLPLNAKILPDAAVNFLGKSDDVIVVAGADTRGRPTAPAQYAAAAFSNWGTGAHRDWQGHRWNPTLAAPANLIPYDAIRSSALWPVREISYGTSLATPYVCGVLAMMLEANPNLTPQQRKLGLLAACENPIHMPQSAIGAGFLNPVKAVNWARHQA